MALQTCKLHSPITREAAQNYADSIQRPVVVVNDGKVRFRVKPRYRSMEDISKRNAAAGYFFFKPDTMRFFQSRVLDGFYPGKNGCVFFVTSEKAPGAERRYNVRIAESGGNVRTADGLRGYTNARTAHAAAKRASDSQAL
jgi:hypothetical protein